MKTGAPRGTRAKRAIMSGSEARRQPCDSAPPIGPGRPVDRDAIAADPAGRQIVLMAGKGENAASVPGPDPPPDKAIGDRVVTERSRCAAGADGHRHALEDPVPVVQLDLTARDVSADPEPSLRDIEGESVVPDPGELAVRQIRRRDAEPAAPDLRDPVDPHRTELGAVADPLQHPPTWRFMQGDPVPLSDGGKREARALQLLGRWIRPGHREAGRWTGARQPPRYRSGRAPSRLARRPTPSRLWRCR